MAEFPFQLFIKRRSPKAETEVLTCTAILRLVPQSRCVYDALWNDRPVILKLFLHRFKSRYHLKREWRGLKLLQSIKLSAPVPLFYGKTTDGKWALVTEKIADSQTAVEALAGATDSTGKFNVLLLLAAELARHHRSGVFQKDLHLGNFLLKAGNVFTLDPAKMTFLARQIPGNKSFSQLAALACCLPEKNTDALRRLFDEYAKGRKWHPEDLDEQLLRKQMALTRKKQIKAALKKCMRTNKRHLQIRSAGCFAVFDRQLAPPDEPLDFITKTDTLSGACRILKSGNTSCIFRLTYNGRDIVVKRYNHKGFIHSLRHTFKRSRARRAWLHANHLVLLGIPTPRPLAFIEMRKAALVWKSCIVTEFVDGENLDAFLRKHTDPTRPSEIIAQLVGILENLGAHRITHGDLKYSNILVTDAGPNIVDLDAMKVHKCGLLYGIKRKKDVCRMAKKLASLKNIQ